MFENSEDASRMWPCPFRRTGQCLGTGCALWNDDVNACGLSPNSLQLLMKTAVANAAVEIMRAMGDDLK